MSATSTGWRWSSVIVVIDGGQEHCFTIERTPQAAADLAARLRKNGMQAHHEPARPTDIAGRTRARKALK